MCFTDRLFALESEQDGTDRFRRGKQIILKNVSSTARSHANFRYCFSETKERYGLAQGARHGQFNLAQGNEDSQVSSREYNLLDSKSRTKEG